jgi:acyl dehydratase
VLRVLAKRRGPMASGDALSVRVTVLEAKRSRSQPDRGVVQSSIEVLNQRNEIVATITAINLLRCRSSG